MAETHETIADIIAEMRHSPIPKHRTDHELLSLYADRLEAAYKREVDKHNSVIQATVSRSDAEIDRLRRELSKNASKNGSDFGRLGDCAKLREAVEVCLYAFQMTDWTTLGTSGRVVDLIQRCQSALAAPVPSVPEIPSVLPDTAKLRDALASLIKSIDDFVDRVDFYGIDSYYNDCYDKQKETLSQEISKAKAALAAPQRNCDRFGAREEAWAAFRREYKGDYEVLEMRNMFDEWLFALAKEGGAK